MKSRAVILSALLVALIAVVMLVAGWNREPTYQGKSFRYWVDQLPYVVLSPGGLGESRGLPGNNKPLAQAIADAGKAQKALDTIGTNHLSMLVARLKLKDSRVRTTFWAWAERLRIVDDAYSHSAEVRRGQAMHAFASLRARARPVVPPLLELTTNRDAVIQLSAWYSLEAVAPEEFHKRKHPPIIQHDYGRQ